MVILFLFYNRLLLIAVFKEYQLNLYRIGLPYLKNNFNIIFFLFINIRVLYLPVSPSKLYCLLLSFIPHSHETHTPQFNSSNTTLATIYIYIASSQPSKAVPSRIVTPTCYITLHTPVRLLHPKTNFLFVCAGKTQTPVIITATEPSLDVKWSQLITW